MKRKIKIISLAWLFILANLNDVFAETLNDALRTAYTTNITLHLARHAAAEAIQNVRLAESGFFPTVAAVGSMNYQKIKFIPQYTKTNALQIMVDQNLFNGFKTIYSVKAAKAHAQAQIQTLHNEEQNQLNNAVAAYVNVYAARSIVELRHSNLLALKEQVRTAKARLEVGEGTRTDYAQAQAAYARATSEYSESVAQNAQAEALYQQIIGKNPENLTRPEITKISVFSLDDALPIAFKNHPAILASQYNLMAAKANVEASKSSFYPKLDINLGAGYQKNSPVDPLAMHDSSSSTSVGLKLTVPLYAGGARFSQIAIAKQQLSQAQLQVDLYRSNIRAALVSAWAKLKSSKVSVLSYLESVRAAKVALMGREAEHKVGQATELDVLNTRSQLITMQIALINAKKELVIASYNLKASLGDLTAAVFNLVPNDNVKSNDFVDPKQVIIHKATKVKFTKRVPKYPVTHIHVK